LPAAYFRLNWNNAGRVAWEFAAPLPQPYTPPSRTMTFDDDNRIATFNSQTVTHDLDGNMTSGPLTNDTFATYGYDARNRLLAVGGLQYGYDAAGNRTALTNGANVTRFVINPNAPLSQVLLRVRPGVTNYYIHGLGLLYEITETATSTNTLTYHYDYRGSTVALTDDTGNVTDRVNYSSYATVTYRVGTNDTLFLFNGRYGVQTDPNGLLHMRARYYNPYLCRFLNADPSGFSGGLNFYAYADGNPISLLDPFGLGAIGEGGGGSWLIAPSSLGGWVADQGINTLMGTGALLSRLMGGGMELLGMPAGHLYQQADMLEAGMSPYGRAGYYDTQSQINELAAMATIFLTKQPAKTTTGAADDAAKWIWGQNKGVAKSIRQMDQRGWNPQQVTEAIKGGQQFPAQNLVNKGNDAIRYVHPQTGQSVVQDTVTKEIIHFGGPGFKY
jgi:RHS repeat-associated protein